MTKLKKSLDPAVLQELIDREFAQAEAKKMKEENKLERERKAEERRKSRERNWNGKRKH